MVESNIALDRIFGALADVTRRDILKRVSRAEPTISELAKPYAMCLAAIAKHISVLEKAGLITKRRNGKEKVIRISWAVFLSCGVNCTCCPGRRLSALLEGKQYPYSLKASALCPFPLR